MEKHRVNLQAGFDKSGKLVGVRVVFGPGGIIDIGAIDGETHMLMGETHHGEIFDVSTPGAVYKIKEGTNKNVDGNFNFKDIKWVSLRFLNQLHPDRLDDNSKSYQKNLEKEK